MVQKNLFIGILILALTLPVMAQTGGNTFRSDDGLFTFTYPTTWTPSAKDFALRLTDPNPATPTQPFIQVDVMYPGLPGWPIGTFAGSTPAQVLATFQDSLTGLYTFGAPIETVANGKPVALVTTTGAILSGPNGDILLLAVDLGGRHIALIYAETPLGSMTVYQQTLVDVAGSMVYSGPSAPIVTATPPPVSQPVVTPAPDAGTPSPSETVTPAPQAPPPTEFGQAVLYYSSGTLTIYNASDTLLDLGGFALVAPNGERFNWNDWGIMTRRFGVGRCVFLHLIDQPYNPPDFCSRVRQLTYIYGDTAGRFWAWDAAINSAAEFQVVRGDTVVTTCTVAAGECRFEAPVPVVPYEPPWFR